MIIIELITKKTDMERRNFLAATGIVFASGITSNVTAATSTFNSFSAQVSLNEFSDTAKIGLDKFVSELEKGFESHSDKKELIKNTAMPVRIVKKESKRGEEVIIYKNRNGESIKICMKKGVETIYIYK
jgi:hypothetical protein